MLPSLLLRTAVAAHCDVVRGGRYVRLRVVLSVAPRDNRSCLHLLGPDDAAWRLEDLSQDEAAGVELTLLAGLTASASTRARALRAERLRVAP